MYEHVLVTGGAGFIGSQLVDELRAANYRVRIMVNLSPQAHYRFGDVRHCFAVTPIAERIMGFRAEIDLNEGTAGWAGEYAAADRPSAAFLFDSSSVPRTYEAQQ